LNDKINNALSVIVIYPVLRYFIKSRFWVSLFYLPWSSLLQFTMLRMGPNWGSIDMNSILELRIDEYEKVGNSTEVLHKIKFRS